MCQRTMSFFVSALNFDQLITLLPGRAILTVSWTVDRMYRNYLLLGLLVGYNYLLLASEQVKK